MFFILEFITEKKDSWDYLRECDKPIFIYGMGDGALKIMTVMNRLGIALSGIFASDEFVRGHSFEGHKVHKLSEIENTVDDFVIVLAFAAGYQSLVDKINDIASRHTVIAPDVPVVNDGTVFGIEYCNKYENELAAVYEMLEDEESKKTFSDVINFRISGKIEYLNRCTTPKDDVYRNIIKPDENDIYVDLGAYRGDTVEEFLSFTPNGSCKEIYALEPDVKNFKKLEKTVEGLNNCHIFNAAAWDKDTVLTFANRAGRHSSLSDRGREVAARSVDSILGDNACTVIKMDVEGAEREALLGSSRTIGRYAPKLMVSLYHRNEDIFSLPLLIKKLRPEYKFYIRHQLYIPAWETNLYCI